jgi:hypothetical protein
MVGTRQITPSETRGINQRVDVNEFYGWEVLQRVKIDLQVVWGWLIVAETNACNCHGEGI